MCRHQAAIRIKQIKDNNKQNALHKWQQSIINTIKEKLNNENSTIVKADKSKAIVIIQKTCLQEKITNFLQDNDIPHITKDPTNKYNKQIHNIAQQCKLIINKHTNRHLTNLQPKAPQLNVMIKTHKENLPIRPVVNNTCAPSHKIAKFLNKKLKNMEILPNIYNIKNCLDVAQDITKLHLNKHMTLITLDIKDLYTNLPKIGIINATKFWLHSKSHNMDENKQIITLLKTIMEQNYFQHNENFYKPHKAVAMGSPLSGTLAELYLQNIKHKYIKQWLDSKEIHYYRRYVDDIIILINTQKIQEEQVINNINSINNNLSFSMTQEESNKTNFLDLTLIRNNSNIEINKYRKETCTDTVIHYHSNHPTEQKMAAFWYYINRLITLPLTQKGKDIEWATILNLAKHNGFPIEKITRLKTQLITRLHKDYTPPEKLKKWSTFTYHSPAIRKITNLFKNSIVGIAFKSKNIILKQITNKKYEETDPSGIYSISCNTCNKKYIGQTDQH